MGANIQPFVEKHTKDLSELSGSAAIDTYGMMHQFMNKIRDWDTGKPLTDEEGRVTSHLNGIFFRSVNMLEAGIRPVWIWEGGYPDLKEEEVQGRRESRERAKEALEKAKERGDEEKVIELRARSIDISDEMEKTANDLIQAMGMPVIYPPSEAEQQAARMCSEGMVDYVFTQDYDTLLCGSPNMVQDVNSEDGEFILLNETLEEVRDELEMDAEVFDDEGRGEVFEKFLWLGIMLGTDYNSSPHGVGPKGAVEIVKNAESFEEVVYRAYEKDNSIDRTRWHDVLEWFHEPNVDMDVEFEWEPPNEDKIREILIGRHGFSQKRVNNAIDRLDSSVGQEFATRSLDEF